MVCYGAQLFSQCIMRRFLFSMHNKLHVGDASCDKVEFDRKVCFEMRIR